jgi:hypothetical protein
MERFDNWMSYSFNDVLYGKKQHKHDEFKVHINKKIRKPLMTYKEALLNNARIMRDSYNEPFDVCLSGGTDSEVVVRVFKELGIKHNTIIFKLENDYNIRDFNGAMNLCAELDIPYSVIDFNLQKFFENEAEALLQKTWTSFVDLLPRLKFLDYLDNMPVFCDGEPYWRRVLESDYSNKSNWLFHFPEHSYAISIYSRQINRIVIDDWYEYTPEIMITYFDLPYIKELLDDKIFGKISTISSKDIIHQAYYPKLKSKSKLVGYEGALGDTRSMPDFMNEFYELHMKDVSHTTHTYTQDEFLNMLVESDC